MPVIPYENFYRDDFQLNLLENYLLKMRHLQEMVNRLKTDFEFLVQQVHLSRPKQSSGIKNYFDN